jgi:hypothetical protein
MRDCRAREILIEFIMFIIRKNMTVGCHQTGTIRTKETMRKKCGTGV